MTAPWLPSAPSTWVDFNTTWGEAGPDAWPKRMFKVGSEADGDNTATGQALGEARELLEWILQTVWAQRDNNALWLGRWESAFNLFARASTALRQSAVLSRLRAYGNPAKSAIQAIFAESYGGDPADVSFTSPSGDDLVTAGVTDEVDFVHYNNVMHIYSTNGDIDPDADLAEDMIEFAAPTWQEWTYGRYQTLKWDTEGTWDHACWG